MTEMSANIKGRGPVSVLDVVPWIDRRIPCMAHLPLSRR